MSALDKIKNANKNANPNKPDPKPAPENVSDMVGGATGGAPIDMSNQANRNVSGTQSAEVFYMYATTQSPTFGVHLPSGEIRAKDGLMKLNALQHRELQELMRGRPDITQNVKFLDVNEAERIAKEHLAKTRPAAHQGTAHSSANTERNHPGLTPIGEGDQHIPGASQSVNDKVALSEEQHRQVALNAQKEKVVIPVEEGVMHAEDSKLDPDKNIQH